MPADLGMPKGFPGLLPKVTVRDGQGVDDGEPGRLLPAPHLRCDQAPEGEAAESWACFPLVFLPPVASEESGVTPSRSHRAD